MSFFEFLVNYKQVDTLIGLLSFIVASVLGYLAYTYTSKYKMVARIIERADTSSKADLAKSLTNSFPNYKIPDLNQKQGFEIVKLQMTTQHEQYKSRLKLARLGMYLFFIITCILFVKNYLSFNIVTGDKGVGIIGDHNSATIIDSTHINNR